MVIDHYGAFFLFVCTGVVGWLSRPIAKEETTKAFRDYRLSFLLAYGFISAAEFFMIPYGAILFSQLNFSGEEVSSMNVWANPPAYFTLLQAGAIADCYGRKRVSFVGTVALAVTCMLTHVRFFWSMVLGIFLSRNALTIYSEVTQSWLVQEHVVRHGFSGGLLNHMFAMMFVIRYAVATLSGYIVSLLCIGKTDFPISKDSFVHFGGIHAAFEAGMVCSVISCVVIATRWNESSPGLSKEPAGHLAYIREACMVLYTDVRVVLVGIVVAASAATRNIYFHHWHNAMHSQDKAWRLTLLNTVFMMSTMCGVSLCTVLGSRLPGSFRSSALTLGACLLGGSLSMLLAAFTCMREEQLGVCVFAMVMFQFSLGCSEPVAGVLKGEIVPDRVRSTIYVLFAFLGSFVGDAQQGITPDKAFLRGSMMLLASLGFLAALGFSSTPAVVGEGRDVDGFYQQVAKVV